MKNANEIQDNTVSGEDTTMQTRYRRGSQQGATLVEIMVVLVILLIGIFLVIRIFPEGFGILRANGNRTIATRLAEQEMTRLRGDLSNLPEGVLFTVPDPNLNGQLVYVTNVDPDGLGYFDPANRNPYFADVNKFRFIKGEAVKIPLPTTSAYGSGSVYTCKFGPLYMNQAVGDRNNAPTSADRALYDSFLSVVGAPLTGTPVESAGDGSDAFRYRNFVANQQSYVIDYGDEGSPILILFAPRPPAGRTIPSRTFRVTITVDTGSGFQTVSPDVIVPDSYNVGWTNISQILASAPYNMTTEGAVPYSETVVRAFDRIPFGASWDSGDPYQYKLLSDNIQTSDTATYANVGVLAFNPAGANYSETTSQGVRSFTAYIDYNVLDWHILREEREVPPVVPGANGLVPIRTTLRDLKRVGDPEADNTFYNGLYGGAQRAVDLDVFDLNESTGAPLVAGEIRNGTFFDSDPWTGASFDTDPAVPEADYYVDTDGRGGTYRNGVIYVNTARRAAGTTLRILYKAQGDWAVGVQKAYSRYQTAVDANTGNRANYPQTGRYDGFGVAGAGVNAQLRFPLSDLNKSFVVTIEYIDRLGEVKRLSPIQMTADRQDSDPSAPTGYDQDFAVVDVYKHIPLLYKGDFADPQTRGWGVHGAALGVSIKTRVIWQDAENAEVTRANQTNQNDDRQVARKWHVQDMDTYLTAKPEGVY
jgi:hypothetical protein